MAITWLARIAGDEPGRELVIKRVLEKYRDDATLRALFVEEARVATRLRHENMVRTFAFGEVQDEHYLAMEFVYGEDLRRLAERGGQTRRFPTAPFFTSVISSAARGMHAMHEATDDDGRPLGLVHRDISPPNLMVAFDGGVKVLDFGIARAAEHFSTVRAGQLKGKFSYMSPEQVSGLEVDRRSDIFSLGTILYEMTTRRRLFRGESDVATIMSISTANIQPPSTRIDNYPPALEDIVMRALARLPEDRFQTAAEFADALDAFTATESARPGVAVIGATARALFPERVEEMNALVGEEYTAPDAESLRDAVERVAASRPSEAQVELVAEMVAEQTAVRSARAQAAHGHIEMGDVAALQQGGGSGEIRIRSGLPWRAIVGVAALAAVVIVILKVLV